MTKGRQIGVPPIEIEVGFVRHVSVKPESGDFLITWKIVDV